MAAMHHHDGRKRSGAARQPEISHQPGLAVVTQKVDGEWRARCETFRRSHRRRQMRTDRYNGRTPITAATKQSLRFIEDLPFRISLNSGYGFYMSP